MVDQGIIAFFNNVYNDTYRKVAIYVTSKCGCTADIEDIVQETFTEVYYVIGKKGKSYISNPEAFVMKVCKRKIAKHYSLHSRIKMVGTLFSELTQQECVKLDLDSEMYTLENEVITKQMCEEVWALISSKDITTQKVFRLYYIYNLTLVEIAKLLSMKESNVKNKLYRTLKEIRKIYTEEV